MLKYIKNILCLMIVNIFIIGFVGAVPVSLQEAETIAIKWMQKKTKKNYRVKKKLYTSFSNDLNLIKGNKRNYTIVHLYPQGWVVVSMDSVVSPVLAYGTSKMSSSLPLAFLDWLKATNSYIDEAKHNKKIESKHIIEWKDLSRPASYLYSSSAKISTRKKLYAIGDFDYIVRPLLWLGSTSDTEEQGVRWDQRKYYDAKTPIDLQTGKHTPVGCIAVVMGQIMRYWGYPQKGRREHSYTPETHPEYGIQHVNFGDAVYNWESMPPILNSPNNDIATVLYHAGVSVEMDYTPEGSGADYGNAMKKYFGYQLVEEVPVFTLDIKFKQLEDLLKHTLLDKKIPVMVSGMSFAGGHAYIIDGYDSDGYYHHNWGWGGNSNGKFKLINSKFILDDIIIVAPRDPTPTINIDDAGLTRCMVEKLGVDGAGEIGELSVKYLRHINCEKKGIKNANKLLKYMEYPNLIILKDNNITGDLNLSRKPRLEKLLIGSNHIASINLDGTDSLEYIDATYNELAGDLNLSNKHNLREVYLGHNKLTKVILPTINNSLEKVEISYNPIDIREMDTLRNIETLYAYGLGIKCWEKNSLSFENNITDIKANCINSPDESLDTDGDGISNLKDYDDDGDGVYDLQDDDIDEDNVTNDHDAYPINKDKFISEVSEINASNNLIDKIHISWKPVDYATYYKILRYDTTELNSTHQEFTALNGQTSYDDTSVSELGRGYYYRVKACNDAGCSSFSKYSYAFGKILFDINASSDDKTKPVSNPKSISDIDPQPQNGIEEDNNSSNSSGSGGGCSYNPNAKGFDAGLMLMFLFPVTYPIRRKNQIRK